MNLLSIAQVLNTLKEVQWDRYAGNDEEFEIYGWIPREDGRSDFILLHFVNSELTSFSTSSRDSSEFHKRLGFDKPHFDCKRVEWLFPDDTVNAIKLGKEGK